MTDGPTAPFTEAAAAVRAHQCPGECAHMRALIAAMQPADLGAAAALLGAPALAGAVDAYAWDLARFAVHCAQLEAPDAPHTAPHAMLDVLAARCGARDLLAALSGLLADATLPPAVRLALLPRHVLGALRRTRFSTPAHLLANAGALADASLSILTALRKSSSKDNKNDDDKQEQEQEQQQEKMCDIQCVSAEDVARETPGIGGAALEALCCDVCLPLAQAVEGVPCVAATSPSTHAAWRRHRAHTARLVALVAACAEEAAGAAPCPRTQHALAHALAALHTDVAALAATARDNQHGANALLCMFDDDDDEDEGEERDEEEDAEDRRGLCEDGELAWERREVAPYARLVGPVAVVYLLGAGAAAGTLPRVYRAAWLFGAVLPLLSEVFSCLMPRVLETAYAVLDLFVPLGLPHSSSSSSSSSSHNSDCWWRVGTITEPREAVAELAGAMLGAAVFSPDAATRATRHARFAGVLAAMAPETLFGAVRHVLQLPNNNTALRSVAVRELRRLVDRAWLPQPQDARLTPFFCSSRVLELLPLVCVYRSLADEHEAAMEGINFYRYLLLRDRGTNHTGVWSPAHTAEVHSRFLIPLASEAQKLLARYDVRRYRTEADARRDFQACLDGLHAAGLPDVPFDTFLRRNAQIATNMELLLSIIERVQSIISTNDDSSV